VGPVPRLRPHALHPVDPSLTPPAVPDPLHQLSLQPALRLEQLHPQALRCQHDGTVMAEASGVQFLDEAVGVTGVLRDGIDGAFEDLSLALAFYGS
jgi:hypothetical protein